MKMNQPIANSIYAPLFIRVTLGLYFILAGLAKLDNMQGFILEVQNLNAFSLQGSILYASLLPYVEIAAGALLVFGMWTTLGAALASLVLLSFVYIFGIFRVGTDIFSKDVIMLAAAFSLLYSGAGALSVDKFRADG